MFHSFTVLSYPPVARCSPSGLKATASTRPWWPPSSSTSWPVAVSQTIALPSPLALAMRESSGLTATS